VKTVLAAAVGFLPLEGFSRKICVFLFVFLFSIFSSFVLRDCSLVIRFSTPISYYIFFPGSSHYLSLVPFDKVLELFF
jgi:hypothetical protein